MVRCGSFASIERLRHAIPAALEGGPRQTETIGSMAANLRYRDDRVKRHIQRVDESIRLVGEPHLPG